ncbi:helix-turn-helix transcriptional regulator [Vogesella sp. DC21W]|uniref:Helix-turn-helix transcriptional regulator n=1 Tax=Vogesella aquatica TaxID=2984206 RepID=A0ABT5J0I5_9NEIS|nr:helix-turn-helix transcriptional regulator [Vogesella aquatica]MDC7717981.1 helix-turn-helix transcriptional regulator [Vogesella aquatica]
MHTLAYSDTDQRLPAPAPLHFRHEQFLANTDFEWHIHPWGQINRISLGILELQLPERTLAAPAEYLVWIPAELPHAAHIRQALDYVSVYVAPGLAAQLPPQPCLIPQTPLLRALLDDFCQRGVTAMADEWDTLQAQLLVQRMVQAGSLDDYLPDSHDRLLRPLLHALRAEPGNNTTLAAWAAQVHSTERTLARRFQQQLGMSFAAWRNRVRLLQALAWLKAGRTVADIAAELGYATPSAFIAMFARHTGMTPERYRRQLLAARA